LKLIILHYQFRPGGVRRVIEMAAPSISREFQPRLSGIVLAGGEKIDPEWLEQFRKLVGVPVEEFVERSFGYVSEWGELSSEKIRHVKSGVQRLLERHSQSVVWMHNPGVGRNLLLTQAMQASCRQRDLPLVMHHHDWWFDNRWARWREFVATGFKTLEETASSLFSAAGNVHHAAINQADAGLLQKYLGAKAAWLPNPLGNDVPPGPDETQKAREWLRSTIGQESPVWILPCRLLRRKNIAEALLLTRWLRPEAVLVTTGGVSSADEEIYADRLARAAREHGWPLHLSVLAGKTNAPRVTALLATAEAVVLTSVQEGFGLPYLEAAEASRPLVARRLPNIAPDLQRLGLRFPQSYDELLVDGSLFDLKAERSRQRQLFQQWKAGLPVDVQALAGEPEWLQQDGAVPFSRLTLTAQLEVLMKPVEESWKGSMAANPWLEKWRVRAAKGTLQSSAGLEQARLELSGAAYAKRFSALLSQPGSGLEKGDLIQNEFIRARLARENLYPLLWSLDS